MYFEEAVQYLLGLGHETLTIKLGLRNTELLLHTLENPERAFPAVQIAGTNGKGSTATMLDSICRAAEIRSGLYTSPHLVSITERIRIAGQQITEADFARHTTTVRRAAELLVSTGQIEALPTFFEQLTAIALLHFREGEIELAILETGMGGRLDSTTAAGAQVVGITPIAMDHEEYLGDNIESIAAEKAAIIRPGVTAVIAKQEPQALAVLLRRCEETGVRPILVDNTYYIDHVSPRGEFCVTFQTDNNHYEKVWLGLHGRHQIDNASLAIGLAEALSISKSAIIRGLNDAHHPGRLELIPPLLLDGAHNPAGAHALREHLNEFAPRPLTLIFGAMRDKRLDQIGELLFPLADTLILTTVENPRSASIETLKTIAQRFAGGTIIETNSSREALKIALARTPPGGLICVTGSLYLIGEVRAEHYDYTT